MRQIKIIPLHEAHAFHSFKHWNLDLTGKVLFVDLITGADPESKHQKLTLKINSHHWNSEEIIENQLSSYLNQKNIWRFFRPWRQWNLDSSHWSKTRPDKDRLDDVAGGSEPSSARPPASFEREGYTFTFQGECVNHLLGGDQPSGVAQATGRWRVSDVWLYLTSCVYLLGRAVRQHTRDRITGDHIIISKHQEKNSQHQETDWETETKRERW